jgi:hypothetical protein
MSSTCLPHWLVRSLCALAALAVLSAPAAAEQSQPSLADLARQEAARRKAIKDTKKVITTKDMPESARRPATAAPSGDVSGAPQSAPAMGDQKPAAGAPGDAAAADGNGEAAWRARMTQAREGLRRNEVFLDALQMRVNGLTQDYDRHNPFERNTIGEARKKALEEIERVKADIELSKKQIADIEEDARKAGVPPGWLR